LVEDLRPRRIRLAEIERELVRLQAQHDLAMSAFQFDEANALQTRIAALDDERQALVADLPASHATAGPPLGTVPVMLRPRRPPRSRRR
jgi:hypothetical protein